MKILILEDNNERNTVFRTACASLSADVRIWRNAHHMVEDIGKEIGTADVISLDHDLNDDEGQDAGSGMDVVRELARRTPTCPILLHTSNTDASWSMVNELRAAGWNVRRVPPVSMGTGWIEETWMRIVREIKEHRGEPAL